MSWPQEAARARRRGGTKTRGDGEGDQNTTTDKNTTTYKNTTTDKSTTEGDQESKWLDPLHYHPRRIRINDVRRAPGNHMKDAFAPFSE